MAKTPKAAPADTQEAARDRFDAALQALQEAGAALYNESGDAFVKTRGYRVHFGGAEIQSLIRL